MGATVAGNLDECWVLTGRRRGRVWMLRRSRYSIGGPGRVAFDASWVLNREETRRDVQGFLHTHPASSVSPSGRDLRTMRVWTGCFGKPLLCLIASRSRTAGYVFHGHDRRNVDRIVKFDRVTAVVVE